MCCKILDSYTFYWDNDVLEAFDLKQSSRNVVTSVRIYAKNCGYSRQFEWLFQYLL